MFVKTFVKFDSQPNSLFQTMVKMVNHQHKPTTTDDKSVVKPECKTGSRPGGNDLRHLTGSKNVVKKEEVDECFSLRGEFQITDTKRGNSIECGNANLDFLGNSPKQFPSLRITVSDNLNRKIDLQSFQLDSIVVNRLKKFTSANLVKASKDEVKVEEHTKDPNMKDEKNSVTPPLKQLARVKKFKAVKFPGEFDLQECKNLPVFINKVKEKKVGVKEMKDSGFHCLSGSDDEQNDDDLKKKHPNRRLQVERPIGVLQSGNRKYKTTGVENLNQCLTGQKRKRSEKSQFGHKENNSNETDGGCVQPPGKRLKLSSKIEKVKQEHSIFAKKSKSADQWSEVLTTAELWKTEYDKIDIGTYRHNNGLEINYRKLLNEFVCCDSVRKLRNECLTFWEERFQEKLADPKSLQFWFELYIPPAQVELFHLQLTDDLSCTEFLRNVCINRHWPQPVYKPIPQTDTRASNTSFMCTCNIKSVQFTSSKPASNHQLAQELAAHICLDWLGLRPRRATYSVANSHSAVSTRSS